MKKLTLLLTLFLTLSLQAQYVAKVSGFHEIPVEDTLTKSTIERFVYYMNTNPINYEKYIREIKEVKMVKADRYYVGELKGGVLYLNQRLDSLPNTKRILILQYFAANSGMKLKDSTRPHISNQGFHMTDFNEEMFRRQFSAKSPYNYVVDELKEQSPLRYKY